MLTTRCSIRRSRRRWHYCRQGHPRERRRCRLRRHGAFSKCRNVEYDKPSILARGIYTYDRIEAIEEIAAANGTKAWYHQLNVTDADSVPRVFDTIRDELRSPLRGLVACAGISGECDACDYPIDAFRKILDVNINGTFLVTQAVAKEMHRANVTGSLVLIASMSGWVSNKVCLLSLRESHGKSLTVIRASTQRPTTPPNLHSTSSLAP